MPPHCGQYKNNNIVTIFIEEYYATGTGLWDFLQNKTIAKY